jgi:hypothetical protein
LRCLAPLAADLLPCTRGNKEKVVGTLISCTNTLFLLVMMAARDM